MCLYERIYPPARCKLLFLLFIMILISWIFSHLDKVKWNAGRKHCLLANTIAGRVFIATWYMTKMTLINILKCKCYFLRHKSWGCLLSHWVSFCWRMHLSHLKNKTNMTFFESKISRCFQNFLRIVLYYFLMGITRFNSVCRAGLKV